MNFLSFIRFSGPLDRPGVDFSGPPDPYQLVLFFVVAAYFWMSGWFFQRRTQQLNPAWRTPTPRWIRWLCGQLDPEYGVDWYAIFFQLPQVIMSVLALIGYVVFPTAAMFAWFLSISLVVYIGIFLYLRHRKDN